MKKDQRDAATCVTKTSKRRPTKTSKKPNGDQRDHGKSTAWTEKQTKMR